MIMWKLKKFREAVFNSKATLYYWEKTLSQSALAGPRFLRIN